MIIGFSAPMANAQAFSGTYTFGAEGNVASFIYNGSSITNLTVAPLTKIGITNSSSNDNLRATAWPTGATTGNDTFSGSVDTGKYIEFTLTAASGKVINLPTLAFGIGRSSTAPRQWQWRSSVDGFANPIPVTTANSGLTHVAGVLTTPDTDANWTGNLIQISGSAYQNLSSISFRLYGYNSESTSGTGGLQGPLTFGGTLANEGESEGIPPVMVTRSPADDSASALTNTSLVITYDENVIPASGTVVIRKTSEPTTVVESITVPGPKVTTSTVSAIINPDVVLNPGTSYYVEVTAGAFTDTSGNQAPAISGATAWNFTTRGEPQIVINQYYEGLSNNKYIELKNLTSGDVALSNYRLAAWVDSNRETWKSGAGSTTRVTSLSGTIPANGTFLVKSSSAVAPAYAANNFDQSAPASESAAFNGDDSVVLYNGPGFTQAEVVDAVSFIGSDGQDKSFHRLTNGPGFDFAPASSILDYSGVWGAKTNADVDAALVSEDWYLSATQPIGNLTLNLSDASISESTGTATATVTRSGATGAPLTVFIASSNTASVNPGLTVVIPAEQSSAQFAIAAIDNAWFTGDQVITITVSADRHLPDSEAITLVDDLADPPFTVVINEVDAAQAGTDGLEFIELYNTSNQSISLNGVVVVLYNGESAGDASYRTIDLSGHSIPANDYFVIGNSLVANVDLSAFTTNGIQNGPDGVALYLGEAAAFTSGTLPTAAPGTLLDAIVYNESLTQDAALVAALTPGKPQVNENPGGNGDINAMARVPDGGAAFDTTLFVAQSPTPGTTNAITSPGNTFASWIGTFDFSGFTSPDLTAAGDPDHDGLANSLENLLGTSPAAASQGLTTVSASGGNLIFRHTRSATPATDLSGSYEWSTNLADWNASAVSAGGITVTFGAPPTVITPGTPDLVEVSATVTGTAATKIFARFKVVRN
jgi:hypothetical protein